MTPCPCLLLVEDDRGLRQTLRDVLALEGWTVAVAASLADARAQLQHRGVRTAFDLVVLDLGLPDGDGASLLAWLRGPDAPTGPGGGALPVVVVSARHDEGQKIGLLDAGADDYLVKPFGTGELLARLRVAMRHRGRPMAPALTRYRHGDVTVDLPRHQVLRAGQAVHLTPTEFSLLARLVRVAGQVVTHRQLLSEVWGPEHTGHTHYLRLYMGQLRAKLEDRPAAPRWLLTEAGVGYRVAEPEPEPEPGAEADDPILMRS